jgi:hypothetical protein
MEKDFTLLVHNTGIHLPDMEIDAADVFGINLSITHDKVLLSLIFWFGQDKIMNFGRTF